MPLALDFSGSMIKGSGRGSVEWTVEDNDGLGETLKQTRHLKKALAFLFSTSTNPVVRGFPQMNLWNGTPVGALSAVFRFDLQCTSLDV